MRKILLLLMLFTSQFSFSQQQYKVTYEQLKEFEGLYEYSNHTTLKIAASPKDNMLYAIINESRYALTSFAKDVIHNSTKNKVTFFRNKLGKVNAYSVGKDTFNLISNKVVFPKEMWYPRISNTNYTYKQPPKLKDGLATGNLENTGLDRTLLTEMIKKIIDGTYPNVHSVLIIKDGKLVFEEYFYEYDRNKLHELRSATKSFVSALTGIAIEKGFIKSKNEEVLSYFPEYSIKNNSDQKKKITIEHLLANQSGLDCDITDQKSEGNETVMSNSEDWVKFTLDLPMIDSAGGKGRYCSGNPVTLGRIIEKATGKPLPEFARLTLFNDLGITKFKWSFKPDKSSSETFCQVYLNSRDMAKFGLLYLNKGKLNGNQIIPSDWVQQSLTKHSVVQGVDYGYLWWIKYLDVDGVRYYGKAAQGNGGQKIYVWEQQNMVTVITGGNFNSQSPSDEIIRKYILPSFKKK
ncbi:MAG TPA: serine hydrolase [Niabella sp.]|nr:serine hydrolase [Niabella sp.]